MPIEPDDVCMNKAAIIERAIGRALEEYASDPELRSYTHIDAMTLNIERACQAAIDLAFHIIATRHLGMPQTSADAFALLFRSGIIEEATSRNMVAMTGFRNIAIHEYQALDMAVLRAIVETRWRSLVEYCAELGVHIDPKPNPGRYGSEPGILISRVFCS
jgi:uncharacterized protein YutE (UPF0331/DUF86 family)